MKILLFLLPVMILTTAVFGFYRLIVYFRREEKPTLKTFRVWYSVLVYNPHTEMEDWHHNSMAGVEALDKKDAIKKVQETLDLWSGREAQDLGASPKRYYNFCAQEMEKDEH